VTATPVQWVLDELGAVVDAQPADHPLWRVDRDNALIYEQDAGGTFDMSAAMDDKTDDFKRANFVGARFASRDSSYVGTDPDLDIDEVVGIRIEGYSGSFGHVDPTGSDGVVFQGSDDALVEQIRSTLYDNLQWPDAGRTDVAFTHLSITNETPVMADWQEYFRYDMDILLSGFEEL